MGTEVLRPQDCLLRPTPAFRNPSPHPRPIRRRREGSPKQPVAKPRPAMGQVTILRRGESLDAAKARKGDQGLAASPSAGGGVGWDPAVFGTGRLGPDPAMIPKDIRLRPPVAAAAPPLPDVYAGSAFALSPSPRALPLPNFSRRKEGSPPVVNCSATKDLRRLLRLE